MKTPRSDPHTEGQRAPCWRGPGLVFPSTINAENPICAQGFAILTPPKHPQTEGGGRVPTLPWGEAATPSWAPCTRRGPPGSWSLALSLGAPGGPGDLGGAQDPLEPSKHPSPIPCSHPHPHLPPLQCPAPSHLPISHSHQGRGEPGVVLLLLGWGCREPGSRGVLHHHHTQEGSVQEGTSALGEIPPCGTGR